MLARLMGLKTVSPEALRQRLLAGEVALFDVNSRASWIEGHVPSARHLDPATFVEGDLPADRQTALIFYCSNPLCSKAPSAARRAKKMGFQRVEVLSAGISGWRSAGLPTEAGGTE